MAKGILTVKAQVVGVGNYDPESFAAGGYSGPLVILSATPETARIFGGMLYSDLKMNIQTVKGEATDKS